MGFVFFTSYSSANRTRALVRFVELLTDHVFQRVNPPLPNKEAATFFAPSTLELGDEWRPRLMDALRRSKVIVCFCSPHYFASKYCGKELQVFVERRRAWLTAPGHEQLRARVIFPLTWVKHPGQPPDAIREFQDYHQDLPQKYKDNGLLALAELRKERDNFMQVVMKLADSIAAAIQETELPDLGDAVSIDEIANIFEAAAAAVPYQLAVACLHPQGPAWIPFEGEGPIATSIEVVSGNTGTVWNGITGHANLPARIQQAQQERQAVLLLTDFDTFKAPASKALWDFLDQSKPDNCAVLLVWKQLPRDSAALQHAEAEIGQRLPQFKDAAGRLGWFKIHSTETLRTTLAQLAETLRLKLIQQDPAPLKVVDEQLRQEVARDSGVSTETKPQVETPGAGS